MKLLTFYLHWTVLPLVLLQPLAFFAGLYTGEAALCTYLVTVATGLLSIFFVNGYKAATFASCMWPSGRTSWTGGPS